MWARGIAGVVLCLVGLVWIGQGTDVLHGSGMSGHGQWAAIGAVVALVGVALLAWAWRLRGDRPGGAA
jgi:protein-S-isoprenylcysteine O-methyltransferase Ste14